MLNFTAYTTKNWTYFLLIVLSFVIYGNSIQNDYGYDDSFVVTANPYVQKGLSGINDILTKPYAEIGESKLDYRPIVLITFAIEHQFFNNNPHISHFINVLLYALCLLLLYKVLIVVFKLEEEYSLLPFIVTAFFAVHPIHTEVVDSLKNRDELLVLLFGLLFLLNGYYFFVKENKRWKYALLSLFFLALTLMSKITGFIFLFILIAVAIYNRFLKRNVWNYGYLLLAIIMVIRGIIRAFEGLNRTLISFENPMYNNKSILIALGTSCHILLYHIKMLIFPFPLRFYYGAGTFSLYSITNPLAFFSFLMHTSLFFYSCYLVYKKDKLGLFILCYFISIAMYSNFPVPYTSMFAERILFLSSLWFIVIIAVLVVRLFKKYKSILQTPAIKNIMFSLLTIIFVTYSFMTISRNFVWKNSLTLMSNDIQYLDNSVLANYIYANNLKYESKISIDTQASKDLANNAIYYYHQAIALAPTYPEFYYKVGSTYRYNLNNIDSAISNFVYTLSLDSMNRNAYYELSKAFFDKQDFRRSYYFFGKTYAIQPKDSLTLFYYAQSAYNVGEMDTCYKINKEAITLFPSLPFPYLNLGKYYSAISKDDSAVIYLEKAINLGYREPQLQNQLSTYYQQKGNTEKSNYYKSLK